VTFRGFGFQLLAGVCASLSVGALAALLAQPPQGQPAQAGRGGRGGTGAALFPLVDVSKHGSITRDELKAAFAKWLADGDTGHGNALAVQKVIRTYARRGAAAVLIEDKIWPRPLGHGGAKLVIERDAAVLRCRAAVEACCEEGILLLARTDARVSRGFDEALARIQAFVAEGAHILFLDSPQSEDEMREALRKIDAPMMFNYVEKRVPALSAQRFEAIGFKIVCYPISATLAYAHLMTRFYAALKDTGTTQSYEREMLDIPIYEALLDRARYS